MTDKHIRHLPAKKNGVILGIVSMRDVVNVIVTEQEATIEVLEEYC